MGRIRMPPKRDFNEVLSEQERFGTTFNILGVNAFNHFITMVGLVDLPLEAGFDKLVEETWKNSIYLELNSINLLKKKFQALKTLIKIWGKKDKKCSNTSKSSIQSRLSDLDKMIDQGKGNEGLVNERCTLLKELQDLNASASLDIAQKVKILWSIEGDENSKYFHGIINKNRSQLAIGGVLVEGYWIDEPSNVKNEFLNHFPNRFSNPTSLRISLESQFFTRLSLDQIDDLERNVTYDEIKRVVWDYGINKSPGPDGFTFEFLRRYWNFIDQDVAQDAKVVKDFRPISLIGLYKGIHIDDTLTLSHLFYADDVVFVVKWNKSNLIAIVNAIYGDHGALDNPCILSRRSPWTDIIREFDTLSCKGIDLQSHVKKKVGNSEHTAFWDYVQLIESLLKHIYPRLLALECDKNESVTSKFKDPSLIASFRRAPRGGIEAEQIQLLADRFATVILSSINDKWVWMLESRVYTQLGRLALILTISYCQRWVSPLDG
ncbi:hypothetical protein Tco_0485396 [Tanacetum coccineum]